LRFQPRADRDRDFIQFWSRKIYSLGHEDEQQESSTTSAFICSENRAVAGRQLLTSSAAIMELLPCYEVTAGRYFYNAR